MKWDSMSRNDMSAERTNQILDAAAAVFARQGFQQARIDDIAREAGVSKGTIYWYFESKERIIEALMHRFFDPELSQARSLIAEDRPAIDRLLEVTYRSAKLAQRIHDLGLVPLFLEYLSLATRQAHVYAFLQEFHQISSGMLRSLFEQGIARGELRPLNPDVLLTSYDALIDGLVIGMGSALTDQSISLEDRIMTSVRLLLDGMRAE
jgi:AcrR family transcriptional regulator